MMDLRGLKRRIGMSGIIELSDVERAYLQEAIYRSERIDEVLATLDGAAGLGQAGYALKGFAVSIRRLIGESRERAEEGADE